MSWRASVFHCLFSLIQTPRLTHPSTLYNGTNSKDQHVLTWIAEETANTFNGSIRPLLTALPSLGLKYAPSSTDYIGYFSFGSEAYYSDNTVIFDVLSLSMDLW